MREYDAYAISDCRESGRLSNGACSSPSWSPQFCGTPVVELTMRGSFCAGPLEPNSRTTFETLNYETNTSGQQQRAEATKLSSHRLSVSDECVISRSRRREGNASRARAAKLPQTEH